MYGSLSCWPFPLLRQPSLVADLAVQLHLAATLLSRRICDWRDSKMSFWIVWSAWGLGAKMSPGRQAVGWPGIGNIDQERSETCKSAWSSLRDGSLRHVCKQITNIKSRKLSVAMFDHFCPSISCVYPPFLQATQFCLMPLFHTIHLPKELVFGGGISIERFAATASSSQGQFPRRRSPNR